MGDFLFVPLIVLAFLWGLWGLFVFLPIKRSETKARQDFEQALENQRRMFERQLNTLRFELEKERAQNAPPTSAKVDKPEPTFEPATFAKSVSTPATPVVEREPVGIAPQPLVLEQNVESEPEFTPVAPEPAEQVERVDDESRGADLKPLALDSKALPTEDPFAEAIQEEVEPVRVVESAQTRPAQEFELPKEKTRNLDSLETLVGRKIFSWAGAFLFVVGVVFFLQIAASRGWLSPTVRFGGVVALGAVFLFFGRRMFRRGQRLFSEALNSAGILTLAAAGYYSRVATIFPWQIASILMLGAVFLGFFLAARYRSAIVSTVVSIGGLVVPFVISNEPTPWTTALYLLVFFASGLGVANLLKRSNLATIPWLGSVLVLLSKTSGTWTDDAFRASVTFLIAFFAIDLLDLVGAVFRQKRRPNLADLARAGITGFLCFGAFWGLCRRNGPDSLAWFTEHAGHVALALTAIYALILIAAAKRPTFYEFDSDDDQLRARQAQNTLANVDLRVMFAVAGFAFLAIGIGATFSKSFVALGFLAIATALFVFAAWKLNAFQIPDFVLTTESEDRRKRLVSSMERSALATIGMLIGWAFVYLALGTFFLLTRNLIPNLYSLDAFATYQDGVLTPQSGVPFFNQTAFATTLGCALALAALFSLKRKTRRSDGDGIERATFAGARSALTFGAYASGFVGAAVGLVLSASEIFGFTSTRALAAGWETPGVVGCAAVLFFWLLASAALFAFGAFGKNRAFLWAGGGLWFVAAIKLIVLNAVNHPILYGGQIVPLVLPPDLFNAKLDAIGMEPGVPLQPLLNAFATPFLAAAILGMIYGVVVCRTRSIRALDVSPNRSLTTFGLTIGTVGAVVLLLIATLDVAGFFGLQPERFHLRSFYASHAVWILWLVYGAVVWTVGRIFKSAPVRTLAYGVLTIGLPYVCFGEFCQGDWRTNNQTVTTILNVYAIPTACYFAVLTALGPLAKKIKSNRRLGSFDVDAFFSTAFFFAGLTGITTLLSFETFRYFTGKTWFGPGDWSRLVALTILWTLGACSLKLVAMAIRGTLGKCCSALANIMLAAMLIKYFGFELFKTDFQSGIPFFNSFGATTIVVFVTILAIAFYYRRLSNADLTSANENVRENAKFKRNVAIVVGTLALVQLWIGSSSDVYRCAKFFPRGDAIDPAFLAQAALSVLWTLFASALLALGFYKRVRMLRWFAIALFGVTTLKVLTLDLSYLDSLYRVVAILVLATGIILASSAYWRRKTK